jgi:tetratricopeptide (TPR) repeat protein
LILLFTPKENLSQNNTATESISNSSPKAVIYSSNNILYCSGNSDAALLNNKAAELMEEGTFEKAVTLLKEGLKRAPIFYPYLYNIAKSYSHLLDYTKAFIYFKKAANLVPEYYLTYAEMGRTYEQMGRLDLAVDNYRLALQMDYRFIEAYILLGNIYLKEGRRQQAKKYYNAVLERDPAFPNALLGKAKILFIEKEYYKAFMTIKEIRIKDGEEYDKSYHYYYAECAFKLQRYGEAYKQYQKLLEYKNDRFFITTSILLIQHKMELSKRFSDQSSEMNELLE